MMKRSGLASVLIGCFLLSFVSLPGQEQGCVSHIRRQQLLESRPSLARQVREIERFTQEWVDRNGRRREKSGMTYQIPVVVHVVWHEAGENISDEQILSQIAVLNRDFRALNADVGLVPSTFRSLIADTGISFCLATVDPQGAPTSGITRTFTEYAQVGTGQDETGRFRIYYTEAGGQDAWDTERYLNIWVARRGYGSGLATFPGTAPPGEDGLVIDYRFFGDTGTAAGNPPYHLGRTVTHEVGHYLNLIHPWGNGADPTCDGDDEVEDTPRQATAYLRQCPKEQQATCDTPDFYFNYMNYTDDACMAMFTPGQKMRMLAALEGPRSGLLAAGLCGTVSPVDGGADPPALQVFADGYSRSFRVQISDHTTGLLKFQLFNLLGQRFWQDEQWVHSGQNIGLPPVSAGIYLLHLQWQGRNYVQKIVLH